MNNVLTCCQPCISKIMLEDNVVCATLIICATFLGAVISFLICSCFKSKKRFDLEKEKMEIERKIAEHKIEQEGIRGKVPSEADKQKKEFLNYCYKMVEKGDEEQKKDCWKIILHIHADCIPDNLNQKYNIDYNVVENVGKKE